MKVKSLKMLAIVALVTMTMQNVYAYDVDVIITKSREQIQCNIVSQDDEYVTYNSVDANNKEIYKIPRSEIEKIYMRTGDVVTFTAAKPIEAATHPTEQLITDKPVQQQMDKPATQEVEKPAPKDKIVEPAKPEAEKEKNTDKKANNSAKTQPPFKFSGVIKGHIDLPETKKEQATIVESNEAIMLLVVTGLKEDQGDIKQIIENELSGQFSLDEYKVKKYDAPIANDTEDTLLSIAGQEKASKLCVVKFMPYQSEYYVQAKIIDVPNSQLIATSSTSSSLSNIGAILYTTKEVAEQLSKPLKLKQAKEKAEKERQQEAEDAVKEILRQQEREEQKHNEEGKFNLFEEEETYFLTIDNVKQYPCKVFVANQLIGVVHPNRAQQFVVPTYLFGKVQIVRADSKKKHPTEAEYIIPKQGRNARITLDNED